MKPGAEPGTSWVERGMSGAGLAVVAAAAFLPRLSLPGHIAMAQPVWSLRPDQFWNALTTGDLAGTFLASHPGLTLMWLCGAAQRIAGASSTAEKEIVASHAVGIAAATVIIVAAWLIRSLLGRDGHPEAGAVALAVGLTLALDPFSILLTGLVGPDGLLGLLMLIAVLLLSLHLDSGDGRSLVGTTVFTGLAVATKAPALLLVPLPLLLWPRLERETRRQRFVRGLRVAGFLAVGAVLAIALLLPAAWVEPLDVGRKLIFGEKGVESLARVVEKGHREFFLGSFSQDLGPLFYPVQLAFRATPVVLCGIVLGCFSRSFRRSRLVWRTTALLLLYLVGMTLVEKKSFRYLAPAVVLVDVIGTIGLFELARDLAHRLRRPVIWLIPWVLICAQGAWVLAGAPFYEYRLNPLAGGPRAAVRCIELGWGAGMERVHAFLVSEANRLDRDILWSGEYGRSGLIGPRYVSDRVQWAGRDPGGTEADCHVYFLHGLQRQKGVRGADRAWLCHGVLSLTVTVSGLEIARVRCDGARGFRPEETEPAAGESPTASDFQGAPPHAMLLVTLESVRADHLGAYGCEPGISPALDSLARGGVLFENAISPMPSTDAALLSVFTGLFPRSHGCRRDRGVPASSALPNLARWADSRGYRVAAFVSRSRLLPSRLGIAGFHSEDGPPGPERDGSVTVDRALDWLGRHGADPWFMWVHLAEPSAPYDPPFEFRNRFSSSKRIPQKNILRSAPLAQRKTGPRGSLKRVDLYDGEIALVDSLLGRLLEGVESACTGWSPPLIAVVGDHGEAMTELLDSHGYAFGHRDYLVQGVLRVPLLLHWQGRLPAGVRVPGPVQPVDLWATLAELSGEAGLESQGSSLVAVMSGRELPGGPRSWPGAPAFSQLPEDTARKVDESAVQDGRYKLILTMPGNSLQLFDLLEDPEESVNLAGSIPEAEGRLMDALLSWLDETREAAASPMLYSEP